MSQRLEQLVLHSVLFLPMFETLPEMEQFSKRILGWLDIRSIYTEYSARIRVRVQY